MRARRWVLGTAVGDLAKRRLLRLHSFRRASAPRAPDAPLPTRVRRAGGRNIALVSHCDFSGNSALHVHAIATELAKRGFRPAVVVPRNARSVRDLGRPPFPVLTYRQARAGRLRFDDGHGIDLIHAFTPREHVRQLAVQLVRAHGCPVVVHLEDNEQAIVHTRIDPARTTEFLARAAGFTAVVDRLLESKPESAPGVVIWPGFDERILSPARSREEVRKQLELDPSTIAIAYTGNTHASNLDDVRSLYGALAALRGDGREVVLVRTGWDFVSRTALPRLGSGIRTLGWVARDHIPEILAAADILVQPGAPSTFNDYRFPSKLPEFLASARPVILPRTNIGLHLEDGVEALLLDEGNAGEIQGRIEQLADDAGLREAIGAAGREFALRRLRWSRNVDAVVGLYREIGLDLA